MKRIATGAAFGWAVIVLLAWSLAYRRIGICGQYGDASDIACRMRATAARDAVLTHGLTVLLIGAVIVTLARGGWLKGLSGLRNVSPVALEPLLDATSDRKERGNGGGRFRRPVGLRWSFRRWGMFALIAGCIVGLAYISFGIATTSWPGLDAGPAPEATETAAAATGADADADPYVQVPADGAPAYAQAVPYNAAGGQLADDGGEAMSHDWQGEAPEATELPQEAEAARE